MVIKDKTESFRGSSDEEVDGYHHHHANSNSKNKNDDNVSVDSFDVQSTSGASAYSGAPSTFGGKDHSSSTGDGSDSPAALVRNEDFAVRILRLLAIILLLAAAAAAGSMMYIFTSRAEQSSFERSFDEIASKILDSFLEETAAKFWNARTLAAGLNGVMDSGGMNKTHLFTAAWEELSEEARLVSDVNAVSFAPFLFDEDELRGFREFTIDKTDGGIPTSGPNPICNYCGSQELINTNPDATIEIGGIGSVSCGAIYGSGQSGSVSRCEFVLEVTEDVCMCGPPSPDEVTLPVRTTLEGMWMIGDDGLAVDDTTSPPWNPVWLMAQDGESKSTFLYNQMSEPERRRVLNGLIKHKVPSFSEIFSREGAYYENYAKGSQGELVTSLAFPVFELDSDEDLAGSITLELYWRNFIPSNFPVDGDLVDVVISNTCGQEYTFRIDEANNELDLVGKGNLHDTKFSSYVKSTELEKYDDAVRLASGVSPPDEDLDQFCRYQFFVYPTQDLQDEYVTDEPLIFTIIVCTIFVFTTAVFFLYDFFVRRRQRLVMDRATRTGEIVSSLFPENVRARLYESNITKSGTTAKTDDDDHDDNNNKKSYF
mmetsp:Transcript_2532/g.6835  ORF Transcript_2532/g.6835 Transcript_2532/m.6835 type:complete len:598 (-) Transcript_2532:14-1807(-)